MIRCCLKCARKLEEAYILLDYGRTAREHCQLCFQETETRSWDLTPRRKRFVKRSGSGERQRATQRSRQ